MKKNTTEKLLNWDAHYVGIKAMREHPANCITLDELVKEVLPLLSVSAPTTIEAQIPVFMEWEENDLKGNMALLKKHYTQRHLGY
jgi:phosphoenolpyruvate synthase/pyruvate phosphate dikinase